MMTERERIVKKYLKAADHDLIRERLILAREAARLSVHIANQQMNYKYWLTVKHKETGSASLTADFLIRAALVYNVSLKWLLLGE